MFVISETRYLSTWARRHLGKWEGAGGQVLSVLGLGDQGSIYSLLLFCHSVFPAFTEERRPQREVTCPRSHSSSVLVLSSVNYSLDSG